MISDEKHKQRIERIGDVADAHRNATLGFLRSLGTIADKTGQNSQRNLKEFERFIRGMKDD